MGLHQTKEFLYSNVNSHHSRHSPQNGRKSLPDTHPRRDQYPESTGNSENSAPKDQHSNEEMRI
jgi:hypothetical protein